MLHFSKASPLSEPQKRDFRRKLVLIRRHRKFLLKWWILAEKGSDAVQKEGLNFSFDL